MFKVTWKIYGKVEKEKTFDSESAARGFFYGYIIKARHITSGKLEAV
jgi:hypothetical protein